MRYVKLFDIANPKQHKTISTDNFVSEGFPVYGANGKIGFTTSYTHEKPTLTITCRGATCGSLHITAAFSYINGNAMALDSLQSDQVNISYLFYYLYKRGLNDVISGSAQPQITREGLRKVIIPLPDLQTQQKIADALDKADAIRRRNKEILQKYDDLTQSIFLEMFGDLQSNRKFPITTIGKLTTAVKDGPHISPQYSNNGIPILSTRNIRPFKLVLEEVKFVSNETHKLLTKRFQPTYNDILLTKGGTTGYAKIVDFNWPFCIWVHIAALRPDTKKVNPKYLEAALNSHYCYQQSQRYTHGIANRDLGLKRLIKIELPNPPLELQSRFATVMIKLEEQKAVVEKELQYCEELFQSLLQKAFKGEVLNAESTELVQ